MQQTNYTQTTERTQLAGALNELRRLEVKFSHHAATGGEFRDSGGDDDSVWRRMMGGARAGIVVGMRRNRRMLVAAQLRSLGEQAINNKYLMATQISVYHLSYNKIRRDYIVVGKTRCAVFTSRI